MTNSRPLNSHYLVVRLKILSIISRSHYRATKSHYYTKISSKISRFLSIQPLILTINSLCYTPIIGLVIVWNYLTEPETTNLAFGLLFRVVKVYCLQYTILMQKGAYLFPNTQK